MKWETIETDLAVTLSRAPIPGGWLVMVVNEVNTQMPDHWGNNIVSFRNEQQHEWRSSVTFVPDVNHEWDLKTEYPKKPINYIHPDDYPTKT